MILQSKAGNQRTIYTKRFDDQTRKKSTYTQCELLNQITAIMGEQHRQQQQMMIAMLIFRSKSKRRTQSSYKHTRTSAYKLHEINTKWNKDAMYKPLSNWIELGRNQARQIKTILNQCCCCCNSFLSPNHYHQFKAQEIWCWRKNVKEKNATEPRGFTPSKYVRYVRFFRYVDYVI